MRQKKKKKVDGVGQKQNCSLYGSAEGEDVGGSRDCGTSLTLHDKVEVL